MKGQKKGLQKLTELELKLNALFALKQITQNDIDKLTRAEKDQLGIIATQKLKELKGDERDKFIFQIEAILSQTSKNQIWENNHIQITAAISKLMLEYGCMPSKNVLSEETGLSRQTINKHINDYKTNSHYIAEMEQFRFMSSKVLAKVYKFAVNGDIRAARLYFDIVGTLNSQQQNKTLIRQQNNYIQINGTVLTQDSIKQLTPEQLAQIEGVIKIVLPEIAIGD